MAEKTTIIDEVKDIEGFPNGDIDDMLNISDIPSYTAYPNPNISDFINKYGKIYNEATDNYHCEPYAADVAEDKHDLIYNIHSYHTKVPPKAIRAYIEHYTEPGDIVLDSFCGTGMTGIAAKICSDSKNKDAHRNAILVDLSTIATFIAGNYNKAITTDDISNIKKRLNTLKKKIGFIYETDHIVSGKPAVDILGNNIKGLINYTVWSDVLICPSCSEEIIYYYAAVDQVTNKTKKEFSCPHCGLKLTKAKCTRAITIQEDPITGQTMTVTKSIPVLINYSVEKKRYTKKPDENDLKIIAESRPNINNLPNASSMFPNGDKTSEMIRGNIKYIWQVYRNRTLYCIQEYMSTNISHKELFLLTSALPKLTILNRFMPEHGSRALVGPMAGTFYLPAMYVENNVINQLEFQFKKLKNLVYNDAPTIVTTQSATSLPQIPDNSIDYIFIDPPFGANIMYSELNLLPESWLGVYTNNKTEAIVNNTQNKGIVEYQSLMLESFSELYRVIKPNRWITIEFHNSKNIVWNAIQEAVNRAGFIVADVRTLNKEKKTINQFNTRGAVDQDLVISAYKPKESFIHDFNMIAGTDEGAWCFVRNHLENLPVVIKKNGVISIISERQAELLFDRMVAYHIMHGMTIPMNSSDFYNGLYERFVTRDGMFFLSDQINEYDAARLESSVEAMQYSLFITNEKTAIAWLYQQLENKQTYAELQPKFMQESKYTDRYEKIPELLIILEENFLQDKEGKWYIPDAKKEGDIIKLREKRLWKEFEGYLQSKGKLKSFRSEAIRVGFSRLWKEKDYRAIVEIAERIPEQVIQEDASLLMYYDISLSRV